MTQHQPAIAFIGGGNMATSIIGGLIKNGYPTERICASDPVAESRQRLATEFCIATTDDNLAACKRADVIVLAVKPQIMKAVASGLAGSLGHHPVVASIAAGIPVAALSDWLGQDTAIVRCMPNTPALVHQGASGLFANGAVTPDQKTMVENLFNAVGLVSWLTSEPDIDAVTALSGSGPAYFFLLMEAMENAAVELGLSRDTARELSLQTALGAATMAINSDVDTAELRRRVTSPGGTTEQAVLTFTEGDFSGLIAKAMKAAANRAADMADEFSH